MRRAHVLQKESNLLDDEKGKTEFVGSGVSVEGRRIVKEGTGRHPVERGGFPR